MSGAVIMDMHIIRDESFLQRTSRPQILWTLQAVFSGQSRAPSKQIVPRVSKRVLAILEKKIQLINKAEVGEAQVEAQDKQKTKVAGGFHGTADGGDERNQVETAFFILIAWS